MPDGGFHPDLTALRLRLLENGYRPVPISGPGMRVKGAGKRPLMDDWPEVCAAADADAIRRWAREAPGCTNTGLLCGIGGLVAPDIDVTDPALARKLLDTAAALLGPTPFLRIGRAPKALLLYRAPGPLAKLLSAELYGPGGDKAQVEVLASGQQFVAYGVHPDTAKPYAWPQQGPAEAALAEVPETSPEALAAFVGAAEAILRAAGYQERKRARERAGGAAAPRKTQERKGRIRGAGGFPPPTRAEVEEALRHVPNRHDWHGWVKIGAAIFDALADDGEDLFLAWSAQSPKNDPEATRAKWASFRTSPMETTAATLFWEARQNGWRPEQEPGAAKAGGGAPPPQAGAGAAADEAELELTEDGVALAFAARHREALRYCHDSGAWFVWTGTHWQQNRDGLAFTWARELVRRLNREAEFKTRAITGKAAFAGAVERYAQRDRAFAVTAEAWDRDLWLLGTPGGVVDLRTGTLRPPRREDMITRITAVAPAPPGTTCDRWLTFLDQATGKDDALIRFLQQWCGYCLTGSTREHALLFVHGPGGNGKSVFLNTVSRILGDYARAAPMETFTASIGDRHPTELAMLRGARLVTATETEEGRAWAEARIKQMTGGDPITARFMRQDHFTYTPQFKLTIAGNHKPGLRNVDEAARRRFNIVPFTRRPAQPDRQLEEKLREEWPAILRWMIEGCLDWQRNGLARPRTVAEATEEYFEAQDAFGRWLAECCELDPSGVRRERPGVLLASFRAWCDSNGEQAPDSRRFRSMVERTPGLKYQVRNGYPFVLGIRVLDRREIQERCAAAEVRSVRSVRSSDLTSGLSDIRARAHVRINPEVTSLDLTDLTDPTGVVGGGGSDD